MQRYVSFIKNSSALIMICLFNCLPIKNNKIFFFSYYGSQYGCSPKYITEYILTNFPDDLYDIVWAFNTPDSQDNIAGVRKVKTMSLKYFYELCTSKIIITNFRTTDLFIKRKKQYYIQTWHSSLRLKQIEKDAEESLPKNYIKQAKKDSMKLDLLVSGCRYSSEIFKRAFWYNGEIFEHGIPRNDVLFEGEQQKRHEVLTKLGIDDGKKVLLYAPTFRKDNKFSVYDLDYSQITGMLKKRFGAEWVVLVRLHPHLSAQSDKLIAGNNLKDVTLYDDIQELLICADVLISDYSSVMFDYLITRKPCFLYIPDYKEYTSKERNLYFNLEDLPFMSAMDKNNLLREIDEFDYNLYEKKLQEFLKDVGTYDNGTACEKLLRRIGAICFPEKESVRIEKL